MSASSNGGPESPSGQKTDSVGEEPAFVSTGGGDSAEGLDTVGFTEEVATVSLADADGSVETRVSSNMSESRVLKLEQEEIGLGNVGGGPVENQPSSSVSRGNGDDKKKADLRNGNSDKKVKSGVEDYDSILSEFDQFAAKGVGEAVGYGYEIGDMVWGKVKSHPWWPGHIYNEALASPSVRRSKREGHVLVAFFGDSSYGWFQPGELVPFEDNFAEKSQQTSSRPFVKAVEEAVDELSRRRSLGLACRCRNEFNFWPSNVQGNFVVDVGDYEPGVYSLTQINKARETFRPTEMLSFVQHLALTPMANQHRTIEFIKNKATVLACRKALYEEFDETYAQAFGMVPVRPPRPSAPVAVDPSKAPLSGRLVIAEALGKSKLSGKGTKTKEQVEKDKYLFKRRDEPIHVKTKKASSSQAAPTAHPISLDGSGLSGTPADSGIKGHMHQTSVSGIGDAQHQPTNDQASMVSDIKSFEASRKLVEGGVKKAKVQKRHAGELTAGNATPIEEKKKKKKRKKETNIERPTGELTAENVILVEKKKRKKEIRTETSADPVQLPLANNSGVAVEKESEMLFDVPLDASKQLGNEKKDGLTSSSSSQVEAQRAVDLGQVELRQLVTDLRALALNPFHEEERNCLSITLSFFLKYRALVYQKSLVLSPPTENETSEVHSNLLPASTALHGPGDNDKTSVKLMRPSARPDDPTKGGKKRVPPDRPEAIKKRKKLDGSEDVNKKKKLVDSEDIKKKKIVNESKLSAVEKKIPQRSTESQRGDMKEITEKNVPPTLTKAVKEPGRRMEQPARVPNPTMLVMKFPTGAALPSGAELRAKFARFGPLDHSATRVFWKSYTCRLVFRQKVDAQAALKFAIGSSNLFGNANVRSYIRDVGAETMESEPVRVQKEDSAMATQSRNSTFEHRTPAKTAVQPSQPSAVQLKSCLKKPSAEEGGNGNGRGTRVKFILGGEGSTKTEQQLSSFPEGGTSSYTHSMDSVSSKNLPKFVPQSPLPAHHQFQNFPINMPSAEPPPPPPPRSSLNAPQPPPPPPPQPTPSIPTNDISQQFLSLLIRCKDVVTNLTEALGYVPYHAL